MKRVFVSGPYSQPDQARNVASAMEAADDLIEYGFCPFVPHLSHFQHLHCPRPYELWMALDLCWLEVCDAVFRLPGESPGADRECARAAELGLPVFTDWNELLRWRAGEVG